MKDFFFVGDQNTATYRISEVISDKCNVTNTEYMLKSEVLLK